MAEAPLLLPPNLLRRFYRGGKRIAAFRGTTVRDAVAADPVAFLGPEHVERFGADTRLLVKLLDAGERLPVHFHPDDEFARRHGFAHGKTEAWLMVDARPGAKIWL